MAEYLSKNVAKCVYKKIKHGFVPIVCERFANSPVRRRALIDAMIEFMCADDDLRAIGEKSRAKKASAASSRSSGADSDTDGSPRMIRLFEKNTTVKRSIDDDDDDAFAMQPSAKKLKQRSRASSAASSSSHSRLASAAIDVRTACGSNKYASMTTTALKEECRKRKDPTTGRPMLVKGTKNDIIDRLLAADAVPAETVVVGEPEYDFGEYAPLTVIVLGKACGVYKLKVKGTKSEMVERLRGAGVTAAMIAEYADVKIDAKARTSSAHRQTTINEAPRLDETYEALDRTIEPVLSEDDDDVVEPIDGKLAIVDDAADATPMAQHGQSDDVDVYGIPFEESTRYVLSEEGVVRGYKDEEGNDRPLTPSMKASLEASKRPYADVYA